MQKGKTCWILWELIRIQWHVWGRCQEDNAMVTTAHKALRSTTSPKHSFHNLTISLEPCHGQFHFKQFIDAKKDFHPFTDSRVYFLGV